MVASEITIEIITQYLKLDYSALDQAEIQELMAILMSAKSFAEGYTGISEIGLDKFEDITIAILVLCQGMYDDRSLLVDGNRINPIAKAILDNHSINLL